MGAATRVSRRHVLKGAGMAGAAGVAGVAGLAALAPGTITAKAAESSNDDLVGSWRGTATVTGLGSFGTLLSFAAGGTLVHSTAIDLQNTAAAPNLSTPSYGAWKRTGEGKFAVKFEFFTFDTQTNPSGSGEVKERLSVEDDNLHGTLSVTVFDSAGNVVFTAPGTITAKRIEAD
jgi:hypothetical protein